VPEQAPQIPVPSSVMPISGWWRLQPEQVAGASSTAV
jgi:hypothetical protein